MKDLRGTLPDIDTDVYTKALEVFGSRGLAMTWLESRSFNLGTTPIYFLKKKGGKEKVLTLLSRIKKGIYT